MKKLIFKIAAGALLVGGLAFSNISLSSQNQPISNLNLTSLSTITKAQAEMDWGIRKRWCLLCFDCCYAGGGSFCVAYY